MANATLRYQEFRSQDEERRMKKEERNKKEENFSLSPLNGHLSAIPYFLIVL